MEREDREAFSRARLEADDGFTGWIGFADMRVGDIPRSGGVYVVCASPGATPRWRDVSPGGRFKGRDPTVSVAVLEANWVDGAEVVYFGKSGGLRKRLYDFADFGAGRPIGHWGGRLIWQLAFSDDLRVGLKETPGEEPEDVESELISRFRRAYGKPPFPNNPHRMGR